MDKLAHAWPREGVCAIQRCTHDGVTHYVSNYEENRVTWWLRIVRMEEISPSRHPINYKLDTLWSLAKRIYHNAWNPGSTNEWFPRKPTGDVCSPARVLTSTTATTIFSTQCKRPDYLIFFGVSVPCYKDVLFCFLTDNLKAKRPEAP